MPELPDADDLTDETNHAASGEEDILSDEEGIPADEEDILYDEISSGLLVKEILRKKQELMESLTLYYRVFILKEDPSALLSEDD